MMQLNDGKIDPNGNEDRTAMFYFKRLLPDVNMFYNELVLPIIRALHTIWEYFFIKIVVVFGATGLSELLHLGLFSTPTHWWKGLAWLVVIDWLSGAFMAIWHGRFDWNVLNRKWKQVIGYVACCAMAAILANTFPTVFYYFQFVIYVSFFIKEAVSILKTYKLLAFIQVVGEGVKKGEGFFKNIASLQSRVDKKAKDNRDISEEKEKSMDR